MENREMKTVDIREDRETMNRIKQDIASFARELEISPKTVYVHKANAYKSLKITSTRELIQLVTKHGLYRDDETNCT